MNTEEMLQRLGLAYVRLTEAQISKHKQAWVHSFVPLEKQQRAMECYCLPREDGFSDYVWHAFSYELVHGFLREESARKALGDIQIGDVILLSNWDEAAFHIQDASLVTPVNLDEIADVVLTSIDFTWTYAKTHEAGLGPYFFAVQ